jgi:hypothetical protein
MRRVSCSVRARVGLAAAVAVALSGLLAMGFAAPRPVVAAQPTITPFMPGRHVYDYDHLLSARATEIAESFAGKIEAAGGGRVVVYTADLMELPSEDEIASAWSVDGLLLTAWGDMGSAKLGATLKAKLSAGAAKVIAAGSGPATVESWVTSELARAYGLMSGEVVFDGASTLDAGGKATAEAFAKALSDRIGAPVYVDIAIGEPGNPQVTAFFNGSDLNDLGKLLTIALAVDGTTIGGYVEADSDLWESYETHSPWDWHTLHNEAAPNGDVQAELLRAIDAVRKPPSPDEALASFAGWIGSTATGFLSDPTNQQASILGALVGLLSLVALAIARRRRRHEPGYEDDDSVMLPAPPADMTPALAALVNAPLNTTRAVTVALLDLAAHGHIAFYQESTPLGPRGGIKLVPTSSRGRRLGSVNSPAASRPLGAAEISLLEGLQSAAGGGGNLSPTEFAGLRPLFEQTGERLERIAGQRGWLRIKTRSVSRAWIAWGVALLAAAVVAVVLRQPVAAACLGLAGLIVVPRAVAMPLPLRTPDGAITSAMVDAYRRTLRRALAGDPSSMPPWLANAEEAALWGYAWGLEGEVQAFIGRNVGMAMSGPDFSGLAPTGVSIVNLGSVTVAIGGLSGSAAWPSRPVGLDTDAIAQALNHLGRATDPAAGRES